MRVPISWLREYVPIELPVEEFATQLSVAAAEIEGIERIGVPEMDLFGAMPSGGAMGGTTPQTWAGARPMARSPSWDRWAA